MQNFKILQHPLLWFWSDGGREEKEREIMPSLMATSVHSAQTKIVADGCQTSPAQCRSEKITKIVAYGTFRRNRLHSAARTNSAILLSGDKYNC